MIKVTRSMLAGIAAERMREQPGCRSVCRRTDPPITLQICRLPNRRLPRSDVVRRQALKTAAI
jgi:hypothetical protein